MKRDMMMRVIFLTIALLVLAGCGAHQGKVTIKAEGMRFEKAEVRVKAGKPVTLHLVNRDGYGHSFDMDAFGLHEPLAANELRDVTFTPEKPGIYEFYCGSPGHASAGMKGVLAVEN